MSEFDDAHVPRPIATLRHHTAALTHVGFSSLQQKGQPLLLSSDVAGQVAIWSLSKRRVVAQWAPHSNASVLKVHDFATGSLLTQGRDGLICTWDASRLTTALEKVGATKQPTSKALIPKCTNTIVTGAYTFCKCATMVGWEEFDAAELDSCEEGHTSTNVGCGAHLVATPCSDTTCVQLWDLRSSRSSSPVLTLQPLQDQPKTGMLMTLALVSGLPKLPPCNTERGSGSGGGERIGGGGSGPVVVAGYESGALVVFDTAMAQSGRVGGRSPVGGGGGGGGGGDDSGGDDYGSRCASRRGGELCRVQVHSEPLLCLDVDQQATRVVTGAAEACLAVCSLDLNRPTSSPKRQTTPASDGQEVENNRPLDSCSPEKLLPPSTMPLFTEEEPSCQGEAARAVVVHRVALERAGVDCVSLRRRDGLLWATGGWDHRARIFEWGRQGSNINTEVAESAAETVEGGTLAERGDSLPGIDKGGSFRPLAILKQHTAGVCCVAWSEDGELLATAAKDGNISVWSLFSPAENNRG